MVRNRNKRGQYTREHTPEIIFEAMELGEIYSTADIAEETGIAKRTTLRYLNELSEQGRIKKELPTSKTAIWIRLADYNN